MRPIEHLAEPCWSNNKSEKRDRPQFAFDRRPFLPSPWKRSQMRTIFLKKFKSNCNVRTYCPPVLFSSPPRQASDTGVDVSTPPQNFLQAGQLVCNWKVTFLHLFLLSSHLAIPGFHDQTGAGHGGVRLARDQGHRLLPLLPHHLRHLLRRPGEHQGWRLVQRGGGMPMATLRSVVGPSRITRTTLSLCSPSHLQRFH